MPIPKKGYHLVEASNALLAASLRRASREAGASKLREGYTMILRYLIPLIWLAACAEDNASQAPSRSPGGNSAFPSSEESSELTRGEVKLDLDTWQLIEEINERQSQLK